MDPKLQLFTMFSLLWSFKIFLYCCLNAGSKSRDKPKQCEDQKSRDKPKQCEDQSHKVQRSRLLWSHRLPRSPGCFSLQNDDHDVFSWSSLINMITSGFGRSSKLSRPLLAWTCRAFILDLPSVLTEMKFSAQCSSRCFFFDKLKHCCLLQAQGSLLISN